MLYIFKAGANMACRDHHVKRFLGRYQNSKLTGGITPASLKVEIVL